MITRIFNVIYYRLRGRTAPDTVPPSVLLGFAFSRLAMLTNGTVRIAGIHHLPIPHFRARNVRLRNRSYLTIGYATVLSDGVLIDGFSERGISLGSKVTVGRGSSLLGSGVISEPGVGISVGDHTAIGSHNIIWGQGGVSIGRDCLLGPNVSVISENHEFADVAVPIRQQGHRRGAITIGDDCWMGAGVVVTAGVTIGDGCVVGAGAVVTADLPAGSVAVGVPARVVRNRRSK
jgi:acetyltransferase-like isoleucine patch superfamily enzyme